jgi:sulfocyanin
MEIVAAETSANMNGWNFNGYYDGNATVVVPQGYEITIDFQNNDQVNPHSLGIDDQVGGYPANFTEVTPVFEGAVTEGATNMGSATQPGQSETITFTASEAGEYAMVCYVPAHANQGMWIHFDVSAEGEAGLRTSQGS